MSAYESGRREPGFAAFERLVRSAGFDVRIGAPRALDAVREQRGAITDALAPYGVTRTRIFGSIARGTDDVDSDLDLLVDVEPAPSFVELARMSSTVSQLVGRPVDIVPADSLRASIRDEVLREAVPL